MSEEVWFDMYCKTYPVWMNNSKMFIPEPYTTKNQPFWKEQMRSDHVTLKTLKFLTGVNTTSLSEKYKSVDRLVSKRDSPHPFRSRYRLSKPHRSWSNLSINPMHQGSQINSPMSSEGSPTPTSSFVDLSSQDETFDIAGLLSSYHGNLHTDSIVALSKESYTNQNGFMREIAVYNTNDNWKVENATTISYDPKESLTLMASNQDADLLVFSGYDGKQILDPNTCPKWSKVLLFGLDGSHKRTIRLESKTFFSDVRISRRSTLPFIQDGGAEDSSLDKDPWIITFFGWSTTRISRGTVFSHDVTDGSLVYRKYFDDHVVSIQYNSNLPNQVITCSRQSMDTIVWDLTTGEQIHTFDYSQIGPFMSPAVDRLPFSSTRGFPWGIEFTTTTSLGHLFSPDEHYLCVSIFQFPFGDNRLSIWDFDPKSMKEPQLLRSKPIGADYNAFCLFQSFFIGATSYGDIVIIDLKTGNRVGNVINIDGIELSDIHTTLKHGVQNSPNHDHIEQQPSNDINTDIEIIVNTQFEVFRIRAGSTNHSSDNNQFVPLFNACLLETFPEFFN
ncbi:hypothetical protein H4219_001012 [Mycoemilia scoparia]|uniref:Uncharacterized protein n=1 Tax=Mycoemilia scoparia TaxID=417184 RepID=A0A9W8DVZ6_9FUNG|nr:hypothetical protein H4219_001012 [Mycoemilia scoparia]